MNIKKLQAYIQKLVPLDELPVTWESGYTTERFNRIAADPGFIPWQGDIAAPDEVKVMAELLGVKEGNTLLDMACGWGRHALVFAGTYGVTVTGIDISPGLITCAKRMARERGLDIDYRVMNGTDLADAGVYDHALIGFNTLSVFSPKDAKRTVVNIRRALKPGGTFFLDLDNKPFNCRYGTRMQDWEVGEHTAKFQDVYFHKDSSVEVIRDVYAFGNRTEITEFLVFKRIYTEAEVRELLTACGFTVKAVYGGWDLSELTETSEKMILCLKKETTQ